MEEWDADFRGLGNADKRGFLDRRRKAEKAEILILFSVIWLPMKERGGLFA